MVQSSRNGPKVVTMPVTPSMVTSESQDSPKIATLKLRVATLESQVASLTLDRAKLGQTLETVRDALQASSRALLAVTDLLAPKVKASETPARLDPAATTMEQDIQARFSKLELE